MRTIHSFKARTLSEVNWDKPEITEDQIEVKTQLCGICRSDIGSYMRWEKMPYETPENDSGIVGTFGHEGLGIVTKVGKNVFDVKEGDIVATWCDPAYADFYNVNKGEYTIVPEIHPKYILQPTACAINIISATLEALIEIEYKNNYTNVGEKYKILLIGTGFMSLIIGQYIKSQPHLSNLYEIEVLGKSNKFEWDALNIKLIERDKLSKYDGVIDLSSKSSNWYMIPNILNVEGVLCYAATPTEYITTNFFEHCWNCYTIIMPSPRNKRFNYMMDHTAELIKKGDIDPSKYWSKGYNRNDFNEVKRGFEDGVNRTEDYIRGYLKY